MRLRVDHESLYRFDEPVRAVAPGQWACFCDGEEVLGGGTISEALF